MPKKAFPRLNNKPYRAAAKRVLARLEAYHLADSDPDTDAYVTMIAEQIERAATS